MCIMDVGSILSKIVHVLSSPNPPMYCPRLNIMGNRSRSPSLISGAGLHPAALELARRFSWTSSRKKSRWACFWVESSSVRANLIALSFKKLTALVQYPQPSIEIITQSWDLINSRNRARPCQSISGLGTSLLGFLPGFLIGGLGNGSLGSLLGGFGGL